MASTSPPLEVYTHVSSEKGLSSVTSLIVGQTAAVVVDPPFLIPDAQSVVSMIKSQTKNPVVTVFCTHHHPDHYFSANPILEAFPDAKFYAHPYVRAGIDREYDEKVVYWPKVFGEENVPANPRRSEVYNYSFFILPGDEGSPVALLGPVQEDTIDHTLFWLPRERVVITGDAVYSRSTHAWVEEIETPDILHAWNLTLLLIESLKPTKIISAHIEQGWTPTLRWTWSTCTNILTSSRARSPKHRRSRQSMSCSKRSRLHFYSAKRISTSFSVTCPITLAKGARSGRRTGTTMLAAGNEIRWKASCWDSELASRLASAVLRPRVPAYSM